MHMQYMLEMRARKKLGALMEEDHVGTPRVSSTSALSTNNQHERLSLSGVYDDILNISPRLSYHNPTICLERRDHDSLSFPERGLKHNLISSTASNETPLTKSYCLERRLHDRCFSEKAVENSYVSSVASSAPPLQKPAAELVNEIANLEMEVVQLERHLLSLYRRTFERYLPNSCIDIGQSPRSLIRYLAGPHAQDAKIQREDQAVHAVESHYVDVKMNASHDHKAIENSFLNHSQIDDSRPRNSSADSKNCHASPKRSIENDMQRNLSGQHNHHILADHLGTSVIKNSFLNHSQTDDSHPRNSSADSKNCHTSPKRSIENDMQRNLSGRHNHHILADHLGTSVINHVPDSHFRLSEDIISCISAVYCKLASPPTQHSDLLASSISSMSSSSTFSPQDPGDNWSPRCQYEGAESPCLSEPLKNKHGRHSSIVEIPKICIDGDKFDYASKMLTSFRSLIQRLHKMDPRKMEHGEQLAFWINIHNALVMHAFLAYGLHQNHMKSTSSVMKAAYNVGGHSVNACIIQSAILGCKLHRPAMSLRTLFTPGIKYLTGNARHPYAIERPEPLVHFALCLGAYSDPSVRLYTAKGINHELKLAKAEFIQYNVSVQKETRIALPRILQYYAKDASLDLSVVLAMVCDCVPEAQQRLIRACLKRKGEKCVEWLPYKMDFRYSVHRNLAK